MYDDLEGRGCFQQAFGYYCVDADCVLGQLGDVESYVLRKCRKRGLWPIEQYVQKYTENDLFDMMEFLHDHVSMPTGGRYHSYGDCGYHYDEFDKLAGQEKFRAEMNELLRDYDAGYELSSEGEIRSLPEAGMEPLLEAELPHFDPENVEARVSSAISKFRRYRSSIDDRRDAVKTLADVLEFVRPELKGVFSSKDEADLFNIANNFGIRHHNPKQKTGYDQPVWLSWMFYVYLATIHAALRLISRSRASGS